MKMIELTHKISKSNYQYLIWHALFLALAKSFMDVDTIMPAMLTEAGGKAFQLGILVMIIMGGSSFSQIIFAPYLHNINFKQKSLLLGIHLRIFALISLAILFFYFRYIPNSLKIWIILLFTSVFSFSGAFANISYTDIVGKSIEKNKRKSFLSFKQIVSAIGLFISAVIARKILHDYNAPLCYAILFLFASIFLAIASLGFWKLREVRGKSEHIHNLPQFFRMIKKEVKENKKLRSYLFVMNTLGISLSLMPFLILYAKENLETAGISLGNLLFIKITGVILMSVFFFYYSNRFKYNHNLYTIVLLFLGILILTFLSSDFPWLFYMSFFLGGIMFVTYTITINGILLEITHCRNRTMYTGLAGAGNVIPTFFPVFGGWFIQKSGFSAFFFVIGIVVISSIIFIKMLDCKH